ncbi:MAG: hypothetical protein AB1505_06830 [Candidatus Latescibacterota bacterium]
MLRSARLLPILLVLLATACSDDDKPVAADPDTPFPLTKVDVATMSLDLADLASAKLVADPGARPAQLCHAATVLVVSWVNLNVVARLAVPVAALQACLLRPAVYVGDNTWRWTANGGSGAQAWTAELTARVLAQGQVVWEMRVSGTAAGLDRFLWYEGQADGVARAGTWHYYDPAAAPESREVIRSVWSLPQGGGDRTLVFENVETGGPAFGDRLTYQVADSIASLTYVDAQATGEDRTASARWDLRDGSGRWLGAGGNTCCWGPRPAYAEADCPPGP